MQTIAISIDEPTLKAIDRLRAGAGKGAKRASRSELIRRAVQQFVEDQERLAWEARDAALIERHHRRLNAEAQAALEDQAEP